MATSTGSKTVSFQKITVDPNKRVNLLRFGSWAAMPDLGQLGYTRSGTNWSGNANNPVGYGDDTANTYTGGSEDDYVEAGGGKDSLVGNAGNDWLFGEAGNDTIDGGSGNDVLVGGAGKDLITGGDGNDYIFGDSSVLGEAGGSADTLYGNAGNDTIWGGDGNDLIYGDSATTATTDGADRLFGGNGNDTIYGGGGDDWIDGDGTYASGSTIVNTSGNDMLYGNDGNDTIRGGAGADTMTGGAGNDSFVFMKADAAAVNGVVPTDTILDFEFEKDKLWLDYNPSTVTATNPLKVTATENTDQSGVTLNFAYGTGSTAVNYQVFLQYHSGKLGHDNLFDANNNLSTANVAKLFITFDGAAAKY